MVYIGTYPISFLDFFTLSREKRQTPANNGVLPSGTKLSKRARKLNKAATKFPNSNSTSKSNENDIPLHILQPKNVETKKDCRRGKRFYNLTNTPFSDFSLVANGDLLPPPPPAPSTVMTGTTYIEPPPPPPPQHDIHERLHPDDDDDDDEEQRDSAPALPTLPEPKPHLSKTKAAFVTIWLNDLLRHDPAALEVYWHSDFQQAQRDDVEEAESLVVPPDLVPDLTNDETSSSTCSPLSSFGDELFRTAETVWPRRTTRRRSVSFEAAVASVASIETLVLPPPAIDFRDPWRDGFASVGGKVRLSRFSSPGCGGKREEWGRLLFAKEGEGEEEEEEGEVVRVKMVGFEEPVVCSTEGRNECGRVSRMRRCAMAAHHWPVGISRTLD